MKRITNIYYEKLLFKILGSSILVLSNLIYIAFFLEKNQIQGLTTIFIIDYIYYYLIIKKISNTNLIKNIFFIFPTVFLAYSIFSPILFILNEYKPIVNYFYVDYNIIFQTFKLYYYSYLIIIFGGIIFYKDISLKDKKIIRVNNKKNIFIDLFCYILILNTCIFFIIKYGFNIFSMSKTEILYGSSINAQLIHYINIILVCYSYKVLSNLIINKVNNKVSIAFISFYWTFSLVIGMRRELVLLFLMLLFTYSIKKDRINKHIYLVIVFIVLYLLFYAFIRQDYYSLNEDIVKVFYVTFGEFILPQYVSYFYFYNSFASKYGITYLYSFIQFIPRFIYKAKPENLGIQFVKQSGVNVGFAFNPIAEGLINFGQYSYIAVGFTVLAFMIFSSKIYRKNNLIYIIFLASVVDFNRGQFSIYLVDCVIIYVVIRMLGVNKLKYSTKD